MGFSSVPSSGSLAQAVMNRDTNNTKLTTTNHCFLMKYLLT